MHLQSAAVNLAWGASSVRAWRAYRAALRNPGAAQERLLLGIVSANRETAFGRAYDFASIKSAAEYRARVPLSTYDDLEPIVQRVAAGERALLTQAPVERLVPSGGSTASAKLIPFTRALGREFSRAIQAWLVDLFARMPALLGGPAYWSITPAAGFAGRVPRAAVPIGFEEDSAYLGGVRQILARGVMAVPPGVARIRATPAFRYATVLFLLRSPELRLISVWHPSFLDGLLDVLEDHRDRLADDLEAGACNPPGGCSYEELVPIRAALRPDPARADRVRAADAGDYGALWPRLSLVSAWADGHSRGPAAQLEERLAGVTVQPKGLLATEGIVTIPFAGSHPLAIRSHFFEFIDEAGQVRMGHELQQGGRYDVVLTSSGGLYRYRLGDRVVVDGFVDRTPSLRFVGKEDRVSDWFGEKLTDGFVAGVIESLFAGRPAPRFAMLAPERYGPGMAYTLFLESAAPRPPRLEVALDEALRQNPHYAWCIELGQLRRARVMDVGPGAAQAYIDACAARGQRLGDIKAAALRPDTGWIDVLPCAPVAQEAAPC